MKSRLLVALLILFGLVSQAYGTTVRGNLRDLAGPSVTSTNAFVRFTLLNYGSSIPKISGTTLAATPSTDLSPDATGAFSGTIHGSDVITPPGTFYRACIWHNGSPFRCNDYQITGSTWDLNSATPLSTSPTLTASTGDKTYFRIDGGNAPAGNSIPGAGSSQTLGNSGARWEIFGNAGDFNSLTSSGTISGPVQDKGGQVYNVKAYGAAGDRVTDDAAAITAAYKAASLVGGVIYFPPGTYLMRSGLTIARPVSIRGAGPGATFINYRPTTGAAFTFAYSNPNGIGDNVSLENVTIIGSGSSNPTSAVYLGGADSAHPAAGMLISHVQIGVHGDLTRGFGTGVQFNPNGNGYMDTILDSLIEDCGIGIDFYGENNSVFGGNISENTTSIKVENNGQATLSGVSLDSDTGPYVIAGAVFLMDGGRFEDNSIPLDAHGYIELENGANVTVISSKFELDSARETIPAFVTTDDGALANLRILGTDAWRHSGSTVNYLVKGPATTGSLEGLISFDNRAGDKVIPPFDGSHPGRLMVVPGHAGGFLQLFNMPPYIGGASGGPLVSSGDIVLSRGTGSHTFATPYASAPDCTATDQTALNPVGVSATTTAITVNGTGSDTISYVCAASRSNY